MGTSDFVESRDNPFWLVTKDGVQDWRDRNIAFTCQITEVKGASDAPAKFRCLYRSEQGPQIYLLVDGSAQIVEPILFDSADEARQWA